MARAASTTGTRSSRSGAGPCAASAGAAVRVLAKVEAGAYGPEEYAVGVSTRPDAQLSPLLDEADLFTGLSFAEAHWVAAVLASAADRVEDAESLLFDLRVPVDLAWREVELASEVVEPGGLRSAPLVPWEPDASSTGPEPLRHRHVHARLRPPGGRAPAPGPRRRAVLGGGRLGRPPRGPRRARLRGLLHDAEQPRGGLQKLIEAAQANLAHHPDDEDEDDLDHEDDRERD